MMMAEREKEKVCGRHFPPLFIQLPNQLVQHQKKTKQQEQLERLQA